MKKSYKNIKNPKGFTLIEVIIVMGIIGILATIAIPSYKNYVVRAHRAQALSVLQADMLSVEQFRTRQIRYPTAAEITADAVSGYRKTSQEGATGVGYDITYAVTNEIVTLTMVPNASLTENETMCRIITLNSNEVQTAKNIDNTDTSTDCWANSK